MMQLMTKADMGILATVDAWCAFDNAGHYVLKEDAPDDVKKAYTELLKKYPTQFED